MAAENTLTIRFKAEGQDELKAAFKSLAKATKEVTASQQKLQSTTKKTTKANKEAQKATNQYSEGMRKFGRNTSATDGLIGGFGKKMSMLRSKLLIVAFAFGVVAKVVQALHQAVSEFQVAQGKLNAVIASTGGAAGKTTIQLENMANSIQNSMGLANTQVMEMQARLLTFTNVIGTQFDAAIKISADMSAVLGTDLNGAIIQVGKALNDPIQGLSALRRVGVSFNEQQKEQIKTLQENGNIVGAQKVILAELATEFGNASSKVRDNARSTAKLTDLQNLWGDTVREVGLFFDGLVLVLIKFAEGIVKGIYMVTKFMQTLANLGIWFLTLGKHAVVYNEHQNAINQALSVSNQSIIKFNKSLKDYNSAVLKAAEAQDIWTDVSQLREWRKELKDATLTSKEIEEIQNKIATAITNNNFVLSTQSDILKANKKVEEDYLDRLRITGLKLSLARDGVLSYSDSLLTLPFDQVTEQMRQAALEMDNQILKYKQIDDAFGVLKKVLGLTGDSWDNLKPDLMAQKLLLMDLLETVNKGTDAYWYLVSAINAVNDAQIKAWESRVFKRWSEEFNKFKDKVNEIANLFSLASGMMSEWLVVTQQSADAEVAIITEAQNQNIEDFRKSNEYRFMSEKSRAKKEKEIRDKADKDREKARKKQNKLLAAQFRLKQAMSIMEIVINYEEAISKAQAGLGVFGLPWVGIFRAMQVSSIAAVLAQKPPKAAKGGYIGGKRHYQGGTLIEAERGEFIMSRNAVESVGLETMNRINQGGGGAINVNFTGNVLSSDFIEEEAIPQIRDAIRRGADIGVG